ncbi:DUF2281 domain-containing protein [Algoriphagus sp. AK58]|uniref:type II toxin-antitoxin system VapB family antitoxin n=1 Tax=Algoriphagus sp. AK58 TaxID=1406877 RepID=UPI00164F7985|nr:DUF2281 domain-containing protein [Algoriphagus sp. AK58]MBC6366979.1 hypothetical protein [Algoriphagus sp. AK58]
MTSLSLYTKLETLPTELKEEAKKFIESLLKKNQKNSGIEPKKPSPKFGGLKGKIHLSADFDEPLDDFQEYM